MHLHFPACCLLLISLFLLPGCKKKEPSKTDTTSQTTAVNPELTSEQMKVKGISDSENLLQSLSSQMKQLARAFTDGAKPDDDLPSFVESSIAYSELESMELATAIAKAESNSDDPAVAYFYWPVSETKTSVPLLEVWSPLFANGRLQDAQIGVLKASFPVSENEFEMETKFEGKMKTDDGRMIGIKGYQTLGWTNSSDDTWKLTSWNQKKLQVISSKRSLFTDVTESVIPDETTRNQLQRSSHQELILEYSGELSFDRSFKEARPEFSGISDWYSAFQYPSVSVIDIDKDGFDDLFVTDRWQAAQLLRNQGDGTFTDVTESSGLKVAELANCAYFADFDNDGDSDAFIGISMGSSKMFTNHDGTFVPNESANELLEDTRFVLAASVVDINRDGLLDLYLSTYAFGVGPVASWYEKTTRPTERFKTRRRIEDQHTYVDRGGPPNIVLMNRGDKFDWVRIDDTLKQYRDTYQTSWTDYDQDGDLDVYICNDFAPDMLLRNDTAQGSFELDFKDVTQEIIGTAAMNFAMGASWGDFDSDGDLDLYVSNMYSKAGMRIVSQLDDVDERIRVSAVGNFLYENENGKLKQIAGPDDDQQHVSSVGWSYGGQFADFDNDGHLDLYVPSGFYSPPKELHTDKDL